MSRERFEQELIQVQAEVLALGTIAERAVRSSVGALSRQDLAEARRIMDDEDKNNTSHTSGWEVSWRWVLTRYWRW